MLEQVFHDFSPDTRALLEYEAKAMLTRLGITDFTQPVDTLSGGQRKRVALATVLLHPADVLILDEPTNHLDSEMVAWLEDRLRKFTGGLIMVTHDRYFLERVCNRITELSHCHIRHYEANYSKYLELKNPAGGDGAGRPAQAPVHPPGGVPVDHAGGPRPGGPKTRTASPGTRN